MSYIGGITAATAAAAKKQEERRQRMHAEEESMSQYTQNDLKSDWEFKIVRSENAAFRKPEVLNKLIEEEAQAGWMMLEKFDDNRVRFKRPSSARSRDAFLPDNVDPYRTRYGSATRQAVLLTSVMIGLLLTFGLGVGGMFLSEGTTVPTETIVIAPLIFIVLGFVTLLAVLFKQRSK